MKGYILNLSGDVKAYVLDELEYKNNKYIFVVELDENGEPIKENVQSLQVVYNNDKLLTKPIEDFEVLSVVNNLFLTRTINE